MTAFIFPDKLDVVRRVPCCESKQRVGVLQSPGAIPLRALLSLHFEKQISQLIVDFDLQLAVIENGFALAT